MKIPIGDSYHCYGRIVVNKLIAFYDCYTTDDLDIDTIRKLPILFVLSVYKHAVVSGRWTIIGKASLEEELKSPPPMFVQDQFDLTNLQIYKDGILVPASYEECKNLERMAVWEPEHVEERLRDHYKGKPNKWVEALRIKKTG